MIGVNFLERNSDQAQTQHPVLPLGVASASALLADSSAANEGANADHCPAEGLSLPQTYL